MIASRLFGLVVLLVLVGVVFGCSPGKRGFLMVQLCLKDGENLSEFTNLLQSIAQSEHMKFIDGSAQTEQDLKSMSDVVHTLKVNNPVINMGIEGSDGIGLTAGNLGLHNYEVAVGFSEGSNPSEAHKLADLVVGNLEKHWHVDVVPAGTGALPKDSCADQAKQ